MAKHYRENSPKRKDVKESYLISTLKIYQTSRGWTVPSEAEYMKILLIGGGGAGAPYSDPNRGGGGGGAGSYSSNDFCVIPGDTFNVIIGEGGTPDGNRNGGDSVLEYKCHHKVAQGGKAGSSTIGGKGGKGYHSNENGTDGKSTGEGGKTRTYRCYDMIYGNGGEGGIAESSGPQLMPALRSGDAKERMEELHKLINTKPQLIVPKGSPRNCCRPKPECCKPKEEKCRCVPNIVIPDPSPSGSPGIQGYCEIEFYSRHQLCRERKCHDTIQHITSKSSDIDYAINPEAETVIINTSNFETNLYLSKGLCAGDKLHVKLAYVQGLNANIYVETGGMFSLSPAMPEVLFLFNGCTWEVVDSRYDVASLYPTTQECKATVIEGFKGNAASGRTVTSEDGRIVVQQQFLTDVDYPTRTMGSLYIYERNDDCLKLLQRIDNEPGYGMFQSPLDISGDGRTIVSASLKLSDFNDLGIFVYHMKDCKYSLQEKISRPIGLDKIRIFGNYLSLTTDGNTLAVANDSERVLLFRRTGELWNLLDSFVLSTGIATYININADGTVIATINSDLSLLKVFRYSFDSWVEECSINLPNNFPGIKPLAISSDGNTIVIGGYISENIIFQRAAGIWSIEQKLPFRGISVAISADGNTIASSDPFDSTQPLGVTRVWTRINGLWSSKSLLYDNTVYTGEYIQNFDIDLIASGGILFVSNYDFTTTPTPRIRIFR